MHNNLASDLIIQETLLVYLIVDTCVGFPGHLLAPGAVFGDHQVLDLFGSDQAC